MQPAKNLTAADSLPAAAGAAPAAMPDPAEVPAAADAFAAVPAALRPALQRRGFDGLTAVQQAVLADASRGRDLRISSQTGSGKTVALGFVLAESLHPGAGQDGPVAVVIAPTRELAQQVKGELEWLFADLPSGRVACVTGGTSIVRERQQLQRRPAVVVGTPGRLLDHLRNAAVSGTAVRQLVLDEADQMLDLGFAEELEAILQAMPKQRRTHLVSATFPDAVLALAARYQHDPLPVVGTAPGSAHQDIEHHAHLLAPKQRYAALANLLLLAGGERTLVFVRTRQDTQTLADKLTRDGLPAQPLSGELAQTQRNRTLEAFRSGACPTLIATDVAARGLDIEGVQRVIHAEPPRDAEGYVHRSGRTGRAGQKGQSIVLVAPPAERRVRRLFAEAKVAVQWLPAPNAGEVRAALQQRHEARLQQLLQDALPGPAQRQHAERLLAAHEPVALVGALLAALQREAGGRAPFELQPAAAPRTREADAARAPRGKDDARGRREAGDDPRRPRASGAAPAWNGPGDGGDGFGRPPRRRPDAAGAFVRFRINWGFADGAEVRRVLAHVCRRGDVDSRAIGAIDVGPRETLFEVHAAAAEAFAERAAELDVREPHLVIGHARHGAGPRGDAPPRKRSFSRPPDQRPWAVGARRRR